MKLKIQLNINPKSIKLKNNKIDTILKKYKKEIISNENKIKVKKNEEKQNEKEDMIKKEFKYIKKKNSDKEINKNEKIIYNKKGNIIKNEEDKNINIYKTSKEENKKYEQNIKIKIDINQILPKKISQDNTKEKIEKIDKINIKKGALNQQNIIKDNNTNLKINTYKIKETLYNNKAKDTSTEIITDKKKKLKLL